MQIYIYINIYACIMDYSLHHWIQFSAGTEEVVKTYTSYRKVSSKNGRLSGQFYPSCRGHVVAWARNLEPKPSNGNPWAKTRAMRNPQGPSAVPPWTFALPAGEDVSERPSTSTKSTGCVSQIDWHGAFPGHGGTPKSSSCYRPWDHPGRRSKVDSCCWAPWQKNSKGEVLGCQEGLPGWSLISNPCLASPLTACLSHLWLVNHDGGTPLTTCSVPWPSKK